MLLRGKIIGVSGMSKTDHNEKPDPFCLIRFGVDTCIYKTRLCFDTINPMWNEEFEFSVTNDTLEYLCVMLKSENSAGVDLTMATTEIPIAGMQPGEVYDRCFEMTPINGFKRGGQLRLLLTLIDPEIHDCPPIFPTVLQQIYEPPLFVAPTVDEIEYSCPKALVSAPKAKGAKKDDQTSGTQKTKKTKKEESHSKEKRDPTSNVTKVLIPEIPVSVAHLLQTPPSTQPNPQNTMNPAQVRQVIVKRCKT